MAWGIGFARRALALAALLAMLLVPAPVLGASSLTSPSVTPGSGTTATTFTFRVHFTSNSPARPPESIVAQVGPITVPLSLEQNSPTNGTYAGSDTLPVGTHAVTFSAVVADDPPGSPAPISGGTIVVTLAPTPVPTPTPGPTSPPTPRPTAQPTPRPTLRPPDPPPPATPLPPGATPAPDPGAASGSPTPTPSGRAEPSASGQRSERAAPSAEETTSAPAPSGTPDPSAAPITAAGGTQGSGRLGWIVLGGMTSTAGAFVLVRQWRARARS